MSVGPEPVEVVGARVVGDAPEEDLDVHGRQGRRLQAEGVKFDAGPTSHHRSRTHSRRLFWTPLRPPKPSGPRRSLGAKRPSSQVGAEDLDRAPRPVRLDDLPLHGILESFDSLCYVRPCEARLLAGSVHHLCEQLKLAGAQGTPQAELPTCWRGRAPNPSRPVVCHHA